MLCQRDTVKERRFDHNGTKVRRVGDSAIVGKRENTVVPSGYFNCNPKTYNGLP